MAGLIDGPGQYEGPTKVLAATPEEGRERVDRYADLGYVQIKIYSSVKPELVLIIAEEAHKRGIGVSGHVPLGDYCRTVHPRRRRRNPAHELRPP